MRRADERSSQDRLDALSPGYWYRGWADRAKARELMNRLNDDDKTS